MYVIVITCAQHVCNSHNMCSKIRNLKCAYLVKRDCHHSVGEVEGLLDSVSMMDVDVNVQNTRVHLTKKSKFGTRCMCKYTLTEASSLNRTLKARLHGRVNAVRPLRCFVNINNPCKNSTSSLYLGQSKFE
jgi:hypothetical protein